MKKIILIMMVISSAVFGYELLYEKTHGSLHQYVIQCSSGYTGDVWYDANKMTGEQYSESRNSWRSYGNFNSAVSALCSGK